MMRFIYIIAVFLIIFAAVKISRFLISRFRVNRWVIGAVSPFVLIIPSFIFPHLNAVGWVSLGIIFTVLCVMFFEISRLQIEDRKMKGVIYTAKK